MKIYFTTLMLAIVSPVWMYAQESNDANITTSTDHEVTVNTEAQLLELVAIFNDAIDAPTKYNAYVKSYLNMDGFPQKGEDSKTEYDNLLVNWIKSNPDTIEQFYIDRQKAHDELYGPRKKD